MSVLILNMTGNKKKFEDKLVNNLTNMLRNRIGFDNVIQTPIRGNDLMFLNGIVEGHCIIVIVAHGRSEEDKTFLDTGLLDQLKADIIDQGDQLTADIINQGNEYLKSITTFYSIFPRNCVNYIFVFYVCEQLSSESIASTDDPQCLGVILSQNKMKGSQFPSVTDLVADLHNLFDKDIATNKSIEETIQHWENYHQNHPCFRYFPTMPVYQQEE